MHQKYWQQSKHFHDITIIAGKPQRNKGNRIIRFQKIKIKTGMFKIKSSSQGR